jgi:hypothetical protein
MVISAHAYPWDVIGDPAFVDRVLASEVDEVTLAASYHTTRAATPNHPSHRLVDVPYAALYRPVPGSDWGRLTPLSYGEGDLFSSAAQTLRDAGIRVNAWVILAHNTRLGLLHPDLTVLNCFGERYPYALCPSWTEVLDHCTLLAAAATRDAPINGVSLESCGQMGLVHLGCHEKTEGAYTPLQQKLLSICCCAACGVPAPMVRSLFEAGEEPPVDILAPRHAAADRLRAAVLSALPPGVTTILHAQPDPWATGPSPGLTPNSLSTVDRVLMPAWRADAVVSPGAEAYVSILPPFTTDHVPRLLAEGARGLALYHLGLAPSPSSKFASLVSLARRPREPIKS